MGGLNFESPRPSLPGSTINLKIVSSHANSQIQVITRGGLRIESPRPSLPGSIKVFKNTIKQFGLVWERREGRATDQVLESLGGRPPSLLT